MNSCPPAGTRPAGALRGSSRNRGRQLDANVVRIPAAGRVDTHTEPGPRCPAAFVLDGAAVLARTDGERPCARAS
ncbi:hypothetical protein LV779_07315 [Streptomyces thinghirensis]|nr:hypothetical protein [Streptomyces thinghirensis]